MDISQINNLDPKLRETYQRIMGMATKQPAQSTPPSPYQEVPNTPSAKPFPFPSQPADKKTSEDGMQTFVAEDKTGTNKTKGINQIVYATVGIIFFIVYTFFWLKLFKIPTPF